MNNDMMDEKMLSNMALSELNEINVKSFTGHDDEVCNLLANTHENSSACHHLRNDVHVIISINVLGELLCIFY